MKFFELERNRAKDIAPEVDDDNDPVPENVLALWDEVHPDHNL